MPDVVDRPEKERNLSNRIWGLWTEWSDVSSPREAKVPALRSAARERIFPVLESQFFQGSRTVSSQFKVKQDDNRAAMMFLFFYSSWENWLAGSWSSRIDQYEQEQAKAKPSKPSWKFVKGRGIPYKVVADTFVEMDVKLDPMDARAVLGARPLVAPYDANRMAVAGVTNSNTAGELFGWREAERLGNGRIEAYWRTDRKPCDRCLALEGTPSRIWRQYAPNGPMLHEHCRCWLEFRRMMEAAPIQSRRSHPVFSMDREKRRKFFGF